MPNLIAAAAQALAGTQRQPLTPDRVTARSPVRVGPSHQIPTTQTNLFAAADATRAMTVHRNSSVTWSICYRKSADIARIPWCLHRNTPQAAAQTSEDRPEIEDHAFLRLWRAPNPVQKTGRQFRQLLMLYTLVCGEGVILVDTIGPRGKGQPFRLWLVRPDRVQPVPDPWEGISGWIHTDDDGVQTPLSTEQIVQIKLCPDPIDPLRGMSPVISALTEIDSSILSGEYYRNFYLNSAQPGGMVVTAAGLSKPEFDEWLLRWDEQHGGVGNAHRTSLMDRDAKWIATQATMVDQQLVDMVAANRDAVREAFGMSKVILGQTGDVNKASSLAQQEIYARYGLQDLADLLGETANVELIPRYATSMVLPGQRPKLVLKPGEDLIPADVERDNSDRDSRIGAWSAYVDKGADPEEAAQVWGLPVLTFEEPEPAPVMLPGQPGQPVPGQDDQQQDDQDQGDDGEEPAAHTHTHVHGRARLDPQALGDGSKFEDMAHADESWNRILDRLLADWAEAEQAQKADLLDQIEALLAGGGLAALASLEPDLGDTVRLLTAALVAIAAESADQIVEEAEEQGVTLEPVQPEEDDLRSVALLIAMGVASRLVGSARNTAMRVWDPKALDAVGRTVSEVGQGLDALSTDGPRVALGGALTGAQNQGRLATIEGNAQAGVGLVIATEVLDNATCEPCRQIDGTVIGSTADMSGVRATYGGPHGGYIHCKGRERCRGMWRVVWPETGEVGPRRRFGGSTG